MDDSIAPGQKRCTQCKQVKTLDEFNRSKRSPDGHHYTCRACKKQWNKNECRSCHIRFQKGEMIKVRTNYYLCRLCWEALQGKKKCIGCKQILGLQEFAEDKSRPDGYEFYCRLCRKAHQVKKHTSVLIRRGEKQCVGCREVKALDEFFENHTTRDKIDRYCKQCRIKGKTEKLDLQSTRQPGELRISKDRARKMLSMYGITIDDYRRLYEQQNGLCAICRRPEMASKATMLCVDHDHATGKVRALLCNSCNTGLGAFEENPEYLLKAAQYLQQHSVPKDPA